MVKLTVNLAKKKERKGEKKGREKEKKKKAGLKPMGVVKPGCHKLLPVRASV